MSVRSTSLLRTAVKGVRGLHSSALRQAASPFRFPAMSPTMTEGGIAEWKIKEGEAFSAGDVLLEIETDKATIDVETQDDGILGKIIKQDGAKGIQVGELIGILVEEGDDTASLSADQFSTQEGGDAPAASSSSPEQPAEKPSSSSSAPPKESEPAPAPSSSPASGSHGAGHAQYTHAQPLAPSVSRLLSTSSLDPQVVAKLKGSGRAGYLTKGDVLKAMGKIPTVWGSKESEALELAGKRGVMERFAIPGGSKPAAGAPKAAPAPPQDAPSLRRAVLAGLVASSTARSSAAVVPALTKASFDDVLADYLPKRSSAPLVTEAFGLAKPKQTGFEGLF